MIIANAAQKMPGGVADSINICIFKETMLIGSGFASLALCFLRISEGFLKAHGLADSGIRTNTATILCYAPLLQPNLLQLITSSTGSKK